MVQEDREYREVLCRVPEYQQPQPEAQGYLCVKQGLASAPAFQRDNSHLLNIRKANTDM